MEGLSCKAVVISSSPSASPSHIRSQVISLASKRIFLFHFERRRPLMTLPRTLPTVLYLPTIAWSAIQTVLPGYHFRFSVQWIQIYSVPRSQSRVVAVRSMLKDWTLNKFVRTESKLNIEEKQPPQRNGKANKQPP